MITALFKQRQRTDSRCCSSIEACLERGEINVCNDQFKLNHQIMSYCNNAMSCALVQQQLRGNCNGTEI